MRCPAVASLGIRAKHASMESPCVPWDTRLAPVVTAAVVPALDAEGVVDPPPAVEPPFISAHPMVKAERLIKVQKNK